MQISAFRSTPGCSLSGKEDILRVISSCSRGVQDYKSIHLIQDELTGHVSFARRTLQNCVIMEKYTSMQCNIYKACDNENISPSTGISAP